MMVMIYTDIQSYFILIIIRISVPYAGFLLKQLHEEGD